jgi:5-methylcytosine-specific restriction endonuclease McrA
MANTLVLDVTWRPVDVISTERAITLCLLGKATAVATYEDRVFHSQFLAISVPKVISLKIYVPLNENETRHITRKLLFSRDEYTCQYCGRRAHGLPKGVVLTKDHCKPVSAYTGATRAERYRKANTWENVTTCCSDCNHKKGDKLPYEVKMYPKRTPRRPRGYVITLVDRVDDEQFKFIQPWLESK